MTVHRIRFEGPAARAVRVATALADAPGVELTSSAPPAALDHDRIRLDMVVDGTHDDVTRAVASIGDDLDDDSSLAITAS